MNNLTRINNKVYGEILNYLKTIEVIDTHEHLPSNEKDRDKDTDVLKEYLSHYYNRDLISAGLSFQDYQKIIEGKLSILDKWKLVEPYWKVSKYTGYGRALDISVRDIYGLEKIDRSSIENLNYKFLKSLSEGHFNKVLKEKSKIKTALLNVDVFTKDYDPKIERSIHCDRKKKDLTKFLRPNIYRIGRMYLYLLEKIFKIICSTTSLISLIKRN